MNTNPGIPKSGNAGGAVFNAIVAIVRRRTGLDYSTAFNKVLKDNPDLMGASIDATEHGVPFFHLLNRTQAATGLSATASTYRAEGKIAKLTNRFFPSLHSAPTCWQWDVLQRTALLLEKCGIPERIYNRTGDPEVSAADWKAATARAEDVYSLLNVEATQPIDRGLSRMQSTPRSMRTAFRSAIRMFMEADKTLTLRQAFDRLKETEPIFWTHAMLSFEPDKQ